jgi:hypothetical protein
LASTLIGLDGVERDFSAVFADVWTSIRHGHGLNTTSGYVVRRTYFDGSAHRDVVTLGAGQYGEALDCVQVVRTQQGVTGHGVVDTLYSCGCRGMG